MTHHDYTEVRKHLLTASSYACIFQHRAGQINLSPVRHPKDISASDVEYLHELVGQILAELEAIDRECIRLARKGLEVVK